MAAVKTTLTNFIRPLFFVPLCGCGWDYTNPGYENRKPHQAYMWKIQLKRKFFNQLDQIRMNLPGSMEAMKLSKLKVKKCS